MKVRCACHPTVRRVDRSCSGRWLAACQHRYASRAKPYVAGFERVPSTVEHDPESR